MGRGNLKSYTDISLGEYCRLIKTKSTKLCVVEPKNKDLLLVITAAEILENEKLSSRLVKDVAYQPVDKIIVKDDELAGYRVVLVIYLK